MCTLNVIILVLLFLRIYSLAYMEEKPYLNTLSNAATFSCFWLLSQNVFNEEKFEDWNKDIQVEQVVFLGRELSDLNTDIQKK